MNKINKKRPSFFLDSEKIKAYRVQGQNTLENDETLAFFLFRPFSIYFSAFIVDKTRITANSITLAMTIIGLIAPVFIIIPDKVPYILLAALLYYIATYLLDVIDGEVARLRDTTSEVGVILDASLWFYYPLTYIIAVYTVSHHLDIGLWLPTIITIGVIHEIYCYISIRLFNSNSIIAKQTPKTYFDLLKLFLSKPFYFLILLIIWSISNIVLFKYFFISFTLTIAFLYFSNSTIRLISLLKDKSNV